MLHHLWRVEKTMFLDVVIKEMKQLDKNKNPIPFSISYRTYNKQNKSGGKLIRETGATALQPPKTPGNIRLSQKTPFRNANHWLNRTINIKTSEGDIRKINKLFITEFNGHQVIL